MWWAPVPSATGAGRRGKKARVEWDGNGCFWAVIWEWGRGLKLEMGRGNGIGIRWLEERGAEDGGIDSGLGMVLRLHCCSWVCKCGWQREMMLNRFLCRLDGYFFLLLQSQWTAEAPREPHSVWKHRGNNGRVSVTVLALSGITRENLRQKEKERPLHQLHIVYYKLTPMAHFSRDNMLTPALFCQWITAYIPPTATASFHSNLRDASSLEIDEWLQSFIASSDL